MSDTRQEHTIAFRTRPSPTLCKLTRRQLLKRSAAVTGGLLMGTGFIAGSSAAWALEVKALSPHAMATLVQMARDIYPHDRFGDELYANAVKGHDEKASADDAFKMMLENGVENLDELARKDKGYPDYLSTGWEIDRTTLLKSIESEEFFQTIRGGLVVGLYNQKAVWDHLGYEGSSFEEGGYLDRGFDDINWL